MRELDVVFEEKFDKESNRGSYEEIELDESTKEVLRSLEFEKVGEEIRIIGMDITDYANRFYGISNIEIPEKIMGLPVTEIASAASGNYSSGKADITCVKLPKTLKKIGEDAFDCFCDFDSVEIPDSVEEIYAHAFGYMGQTLPSGANVYEKIDDFTVICAPGSAAEKYAKYNGFKTKPIAK